MAQLIATPAPLTIVSGLPRSGTSLLMRMLEAGGVPPLTDRLRRADEDNPLGYYEFEPVKQTATDAAWLELAVGKAVKMVYRLLYDLPAHHTYRVLFALRSLDEVLASQRKMLARQGRADGTADASLAQLFASELARVEAWLAAQPNFAVCRVHYHELIADPRGPADAINRFLGGGLDVPRMCAVVEPALYRNRQGGGETTRGASGPH